MKTENEALNRYFDHVIQEGLYSTQRRLKFYLNYLFDGVNFDNKQMLDIGAGSGLFSFYAACSGAKKLLVSSLKQTDSSLIQITNSKRFNPY